MNHPSVVFIYRYIIHFHRPQFTIFTFSLFHTENDVKARNYVKQLMTEAGLVVTQDALGSIFGTFPADADTTTDGSSSSSSSTACAVGTGSHCDAIPLAGMYDGTVGVIGGIAALKALKQAGFKPKRPLQVIFFTSEEPTRFGLSCIGSRGMAGALPASQLAALRDENGTSFLEAAAFAGAGGGAETEEQALAAAKLTPAQLSFFVELHIEQGPELEAQGVDIGVVTAIAAPAALKISFHGDGGHAGAQLMPLRNDASLAAAELALLVEAAALETGAVDTVATTGRWEIGPNAINSVPREAALEIDVRDVDEERRNAVVKKIITGAQEIAAKRAVKVEHVVINSDPPATSGAEVMAAVGAAADALGLTRRSMPSRAYHDTLFMAQIAPSGMIFIPCRNGWSHRPDEYAAAVDIENGVRVLAGAMAQLAGGGAVGDGGVKDEL